MRTNSKYPIIEHLEIVDVAAEGKSIAKLDNMVFFVSNAVPGDIVDVQITNKQRNFREGYPVHYHKLSENRATPFCEHFGMCGGCKWQNLPYTEQLKYKEKQVLDSFERIGKIDLGNVKKNPIFPSAKTQYYRNKLEFTFSNYRWLEKAEMALELPNCNGLGFHIPKMFDKVLDLNNCYLQGNLSNSIRLAVKEFALEKNYTFYDLRKQHGFLRNLIIRNSINGELMVIVVFHENDEEKIEEMLMFIHKTFPDITSLMYIINNKHNDSYNDLDVIPFKGKDHIIETMENLHFKVGPKSFFQTNSEQAYNLYKFTRNFAQLTGKEVVYDLYTGTGTIANFVAKQAKKVIGIEYIPEAIDDARINSKINGITNTTFMAGDAKEIVNKTMFEKYGAPDVIITDPPRDGMHKYVVETILEANPQRIVYVSCNPATQARDLLLMSDNYKLLEFQPVDMFPHTQHVENVVVLERR